MSQQAKYKITEPVGTSNGFWYDISDGGYIVPEDILHDQERAKKLNEARDLLEEFKRELEEDEMLNDM
jgi:hypothetical protein